MRNLSGNALNHILKNNPNLRCLYLERSTYAGIDSTLQVLSCACPLLKTLSVCYCSRITDVGIKHISLGCKYLRDLNIGHCSEITSNALLMLVQRCNLLKVLSLECKFLSIVRIVCTINL
jgi:hypothetical protein